MSETFGEALRRHDYAKAMMAWEGFGPDDPDAPMNNGVPRPGTPRQDSHHEPRRESRPSDDAATDKQKGFLRALLAEREGNPNAEQIRTALNVAREHGALTRKLASACIESLTKIAKNAPEASRKPSGNAEPFPAEVPAGYYAVENEEGSLRFYQVDRPEQGKWAGYTFVSVLASDERHPVKGAAGKVVLAKIAVDPLAAARRYGQEIGRCSRCHRTLTNEESRAYGIGPECRSKSW